MAQSNGDELRRKVQDIFNDCTSGWLITIKDFNGDERSLGSLEDEIIADIVDLLLADRKQHELELLDRLEAKKLEVQSAEEHLWYILDAIQAERERLGK